MNLKHSRLDVQSAGETTYPNVLTMLENELESTYMEHLLWMNQLENDPVHRKILQTKGRLCEQR